MAIINETPDTYVQKIICTCIYIHFMLHVHVPANVARRHLAEDKIKTIQAVVFIIHIAAHLPQGAR